MKPIIYIVVPCYNEEQVLPITSELFVEKIKSLISNDKISPDSCVMFVDDGSFDNTWGIITGLSERHDCVKGISLSRNRGHQNALLAGLMEAKKFCDITISIDCDGQDDINAMDEMVEEYLKGSDIVYGVRSDRRKDSFFKRKTAHLFYRIMKLFGAETVYNHADYRLLSKRVLDELESYKEVNIYLRGMIPLVGFKSTSVYYSRDNRLAGKSHYPMRKMLGLAVDGITSLTVKPIHIISMLGFFVALFSFVGIIWSIVSYATGNVVPGWASMTCIICFVSGVQLISLGVIGEYVGKIYMETKARPKYIIKEKTYREEVK